MHNYFTRTLICFSPGGSRRSSPSTSPRRTATDKMNVSTKSAGKKDHDVENALPNLNERLGRVIY